MSDPNNRPPCDNCGDPASMIGLHPDAGTVYTCEACAQGQGFKQLKAWDSWKKPKPAANNLEGDPPTAEERAAMSRELDAVAPTPADKFRLMFRERPTPRTDAVLNTFDGNASKLAADLATHSEELERELAEIKEQLETECMRLAAIGVVVLADTVASRDQARDMLAEYRSAALSDVERRVDECIALREQLESWQKLALSAELLRKKTERQLAEALEEGEEQARLLSMSGEREAGLLAEIDRLDRELAGALDQNTALHEAAAYLNGRLRDLTVERDNAETELEGGTDDA